MATTSPRIRPLRARRRPTVPAGDVRAEEYDDHPYAPTARHLARGTAPEPMELHADGVSEVLIRRITIPVSGSTGRHFHPGDVLAVVEQGELTHVADNGPTHVYHAGDALLEPRGEEHVHEGINTGGDEVVLLVTYLNSSAGPLAVSVG
ncbi:cupin domain-containing protein [Streptomyces sp. NBC_01264]|uniref:cupin domain-containing protein n=1 Tax=Streptomyces sp. NBC_01264 TaxID=2903804 RepID=UPI00225B480D|nr:cupin domain-containing protein [Streptomyces sp. NBC_01264]MCX4781792.1 cupin domain-containing protein [Streptomyces sp. NBC_01264]